MAKFNFKLAPILSIKEKIEDLKKNELAKAIMALEAEKAKLAQLRQTRADCIESFRNSINTGVKPIDIRQHNIFLDRLKVLIREQKEAIVRAEAKVEEARLALVEAMRERKSLDKLKENDYEEYLVEEKKAEQKGIDEVVSYKTAVLSKNNE
ncbi:MAG: flagellar export protein FliJ [Clostridiales bacterium]|jgi:flagellar FliJ protein|nr:flagellar export protein FliJ [Clostridiales bacterium]